MNSLRACSARTAAMPAGWGARLSRPAPRLLHQAPCIRTNARAFVNPSPDPSTLVSQVSDFAAIAAVPGPTSSTAGSAQRHAAMGYT